MNCIKIMNQIWLTLLVMTTSFLFDSCTAETKGNGTPTEFRENDRVLPSQAAREVLSQEKVWAAALVTEAENDVADLEMVASIMHGAWPYNEELKAMMYMYPNMYFDIAATNWVLPKEEFYHCLKSLVRAGFGDRIMYGSDQMVWPQLIAVGIETINRADFLSIEQKEDIFYDNAAAFPDLTKEEIDKHKETTDE